MPIDPSHLRVPLWAFREPPPGLSLPWERVYIALADPVTQVVALRGLAKGVGLGSRELLSVWLDKLRASEQAARAVLQFQRGPAPRIWRAGYAIQMAVSGISGAMAGAVHIPGMTEKQHEQVRAQITDKLKGFEENPLLDELAAAFMQAAAAGSTADSATWLSLAEAEQISGINRGVISKAIDAGALKSNGEKGKGKRKVDAANFATWNLARLKRPESNESDAQVRKQVKRNVKDAKLPP